MENRVVVTGGAGFIGSYLVDALVEKGFQVDVVDDLSGSTLEYIQPHVDGDRICFHRRDLRKECKDLFEGIDTVFHFAASSDVKVGNREPKNMYENNVTAAFNVLEACRENGVSEMVFASSSTVYGEADEIPTPEDYGIDPISLYGSTKAACESLIRSYSSLYGIDSTILRYANIFGPRSDKGVMHDFFHKLREDQNKLEILGDGTQNKSYLYIDDCVDATLTAWKGSGGGVEAYNVGSKDQLTVNEIADSIVKAVGLENVDYEYTGGSRGWRGDVPVMLLDTSKIEGLGWEQEVSIGDGIEKYIEWLAEEK